MTHLHSLSKPALLALGALITLPQQALADTTQPGNLNGGAIEAEHWDYSSDWGYPDWGHRSIHRAQAKLDAGLIDAARRGDSAAFNQALTQGANLNAVGLDSTNAVLAATEGEQHHMLRLLLDKGGNPDVVGASGFTPLTYAVTQDRIGDIRLLLKAGANPNQPNATGSTPLHLAVELGHNELIEELVAAGARLNDVNGLGETAIIIAIRVDNQPALETLLALGANTNIGDRTGRSPLFWAVLESREEMAVALLQYGARANSRSTIDGYTPLQLARVMQQRRVVAAITERDGIN